MKSWGVRPVVEGRREGIMEVPIRRPEVRRGSQLHHFKRLRRSYDFVGKSKTREGNRREEEEIGSITSLVYCA